MSRYTIFAVIAALCLTVASGATQSISLTSGSFASAPGPVFDASSSTAVDYTASTGWQTFTNIKYGPAATNSTIYAYGIKLTTASGTTTLTSVTIRSVNASMVSNGTVSTSVSDSKIGTDATVSPGTALVGSSVQVGIGLGSIGIAYVANDANTCPQVYLLIISAGASLVTKAVTSNTCVDCSTANAAGAAFAYVVGTPVYDNSTYFVPYTTTKTTTPYTTSCGTAAQQVVGYLQGVAVSSAGTLSYATVPTVYSGTSAATASPTGTEVALTCGPTNYTNSTNIMCAYRDAAAGGSGNLKAIPVTVSSGTVGTAVTIATDVTPASSAAYPQVTQSFSVGGFIYSLYQQGVIISNATSSLSAASGGTTTYTNTLQIYNQTTGATATAGGVQITTLTNSYSGGTAYRGAGLTYGTGYVILDQYMSSATANTFEYSPFFANGTANGTRTSVGTTPAVATGNWFTDANGALWFGAWTYDDTATTALSGQVGKVIAQLYSAGNIIASFFALISLMIAALFAF